MRPSLFRREHSQRTFICLRRAIVFIIVMAYMLASDPRRAVADVNHEVDTANWIALPITAVDGFFATPWACGGPAPATQLMVQFHQNWHCSNPDHTGPNWGNRFFGFHKQFLFGYDRYLASVGEPYVQTWVAASGALIPPAHGGRPNNAPCNACLDLPSTFKLPAAGGTLDTFATLGSIGDAIVGWHNTNHGNIAAAGGAGSCSGGSADMNCPAFSTRDPIFYRYHHIFDDVQDAWRTHQATDIAIVFDRSGSMSLPTTGGGTRLDAAKAAASLFADLLEDGSSHRLGMVSFSTTASAAPDMALTSVAGAPAALTAALGGIVASGNTSIGDGLEKAQTMIAAGAEPRKAILLLTDGMENTSPTIADAETVIGDTHVCSVGLGTPGSLDGPKLQDLSQRQGGIYISTPSPLELKKFFVFCFANIFDTFVGEDPIDVLPASQLVSKPTVHMAYQDEKLVFVLSWTNPMPPGSLRLAVTSPSGTLVNLAGPGVESVFGPTWHIVRIKTPYRSERDGRWTARAVRPVRNYVNGFSSNSFADFAQGVGLVRDELANLCSKGCRNVLYYEDEMAHENFEDHNSIYADALYGEAGRGAIGHVTRPQNAAEFAQALKERRYDLLVYSSQFTGADQPYDGLLSEILCSGQAAPSIVSDNRDTAGARAILRCAGALRGEGKNFTSLAAAGSSLPESDAKLRPGPHVGVFSYELKPAGANVSSQAKSASGMIAVLARGETGKDESFFITALTRANAKVKPFVYRSNYYTLESLHPTFHIPEMYWPAGGFDKVTATVDVTRPLMSLGRLASLEPGEPSSIGGDPLTPVEAALLRMEKAGKTIPVETKRFTLYDDGTHGDGGANDRYWEASLPPDFAKFDGDYRFHANFELCKGKICIHREADQAVTVRTHMGPGSKVSVTSQGARGGSVFTVLVTPVDQEGTPLGPGLVHELLLKTTGEAKITGKGDYDRKGTYQIAVNWSGKGPQPTLTIAQFGRPASAITVPLK